MICTQGLFGLVGAQEFEFQQKRWDEETRALREQVATLEAQIGKGKQARPCCAALRCVASS